MSIFGKKKIQDEENEDNIKFTCKIGRMGKDGMMIWVPKRYYSQFDRGSYVEVTIRRLK
jgi:hypothetical protein